MFFLFIHFLSGSSLKGFDFSDECDILILCHFKAWGMWCQQGEVVAGKHQRFD